MDSDIETRLRRVEDELAIRALVARYYTALDNGDTDAFATFWTEDGVFRTETGQGEIVVSGRVDIAALCSGSRFGSMHFATDSIISLDGDTARHSCRVVLGLRRSERTPGSSRWDGSATYQDTLRRTEDGWRFTSRHFRPDAFLSTPWPP
jgi:uncharacterized protein (TIGR02246 family)